MNPIIIEFQVLQAFLSALPNHIHHEILHVEHVTVAQACTEAERQLNLIMPTIATCLETRPTSSELDEVRHQVSVLQTELKDSSAPNPSTKIPITCRHGHTQRNCPSQPHQPPYAHSFLPIHPYSLSPLPYPSFSPYFLPPFYPLHAPSSSSSSTNRAHPHLNNSILHHHYLPSPPPPPFNL